MEVVLPLVALWGGQEGLSKGWPPPRDLDPPQVRGCP